MTFAFFWPTTHSSRRERLGNQNSLLDSFSLFTCACCSAFAKYNKDQLTPVRVEGSTFSCLVSDHNDLGGGRFVDPRSKTTFKYDHLRKEATDSQVGT